MGQTFKSMGSLVQRWCLNSTCLLGMTGATLLFMSSGCQWYNRIWWQVNGDVTTATATSTENVSESRGRRRRRRGQIDLYRRVEFTYTVADVVYEDWYKAPWGDTPMLGDTFPVLYLPGKPTANYALGPRDDTGKPGFYFWLGVCLLFWRPIAWLINLIPGVDVTFARR